MPTERTSCQDYASYFLFLPLPPQTQGESNNYSKLISELQQKELYLVINIQVLGKFTCHPSSRTERRGGGCIRNRKARSILIPELFLPKWLQEAFALKNKNQIQTKTMFSKETKTSKGGLQVSSLSAQLSLSKLLILDPSLK